MTAGYPGDQGERSLFEDRRPMTDGEVEALTARFRDGQMGPPTLLPGPANATRTVHLSWRSAWRVGVMVWLALVAFAATAVVVSAVAAAMLAQSVQP